MNVKLAIGSCSGKESRHIEYMKVDLSRMQKESDALIGRVGAPVVQCLRLRTRHLVDCFDGQIVSWSIGTRPDATLVNTILDDAIGTLSANDKPVIHSDCGGHYRWPGWLDRINTSGLIRSMSRKGCSSDNAACEGFFGRVKNEMFYGRNWAGITLEKFICFLDRYIRWYNEKRIKLSLGAMSPVKYRQHLGITT